MTAATNPAISLEQAQQLVELLKADQQEEADALFFSLKDGTNDGLFDSIGKLTRQLHNSLTDFQLDPRLAKFTEDELPDAQNRLHYVIQRTEDAANRTMDAVEASLPLAEQMGKQIQGILPTWQKLMNNDIDLNEFKGMCHQVNDFIEQSAESSEHLHMLLTEVLMAQDFQDLTGQVIRRVIELVQEVEESLIELLTVFGDHQRRTNPNQAQQTPAKPEKVAQKAEKNIGPEGPVIDPDARDDVVKGQDDVDDLLSSLGF